MFDEYTLSCLRVPMANTIFHRVRGKIVREIISLLFYENGNFDFLFFEFKKQERKNDLGLVCTYKEVIPSSKHRFKIQMKLCLTL